MSLFSSALASGQLGPLMNQFGLPSEAVDAANKGGKYASFLSSTDVPNHILYIQIVTCRLTLT